MESDSNCGRRFITLRQKQTLVAVYQKTGNMSHAMHEAGIKSPRTAYLWWRRYSENGEAGLQPHSHARHTRERVAVTLAEEICTIRRRHPDWGRRQIASTLAERYGRQIVSPAGVEAVLRRHDLWASPPTAPSEALVSPVPTRLRRDEVVADLLTAIQDGIRLSLRSEARAAVQRLGDQVWRPLDADPLLRNRLLRSGALGAWLLVSRLHLGHSLINCGRWDEASYHLRQPLDWLSEQPDGQQTHPWEEEPNIVSLRRDDIWLGSCHHLALVWGKRNPAEGIAYLQTALSTIRRRYHPVVPGHISQVGSIERDLAHLKLRLRRSPVDEIRQHLTLAQQTIDESGSPGEQAFTHFAWAKLFGHLAMEAGNREHFERRRELNNMERAIEYALHLVERDQEDRPMRLTLCYVDAAQLSGEHGIPLDAQRVTQAAEYCLRYGYGHQAQELLSTRSIHLVLGEEIRENLAALSRGD